jgi:hypothetical protein
MIGGGPSSIRPAGYPAVTQVGGASIGQLIRPLTARTQHQPKHDKGPIIAREIPWSAPLYGAGDGNRTASRAWELHDIRKDRAIERRF